MSNSPLVVYTKISPYRTVNRESKIDKITIHHMAGNLSIETCGNVFQNRQASANYGVGTDGRVGMYVEEKDRAWTSSNSENDHRAVTIEVANCGGAPDWKVSDKALAATIELCVDICKRNGIKKLNYTGDKSGNLTMHKWFANTLCPGPYLGGKFPYIAQEVNKRLSAGKVQQATSAPVSGGTTYRVQVGSFSKKAAAEKKLQAVEAAGFGNVFLACVDNKLWRVQIGPYAEKAAAEKRLAEVQAADFSGFVTTLSGTTEKLTKPTKTVDELAREVIAGKHGSGQARKDSLGNMYKAVQARVNELLAEKAKPKKTIDELAREVIAGKHGSGQARKDSLGDQYKAVQARVNELLAKK